MMITLLIKGCSCSGVKVDDWLRAERLAHDVMFDLNNYAQGQKLKDKIRKEDDEDEDEEGGEKI